MKLQIDLAGVHIPSRDGEDNEYVHRQAAESQYFDRTRKVLFINGMNTSALAHAEYSLALSLVQMCTVVGVYNATAGWAADLAQCIGDKNQFNGPVALSARHKVQIGSLPRLRTPEEVARQALERNKAQVTVFDLLRRSHFRHRAIFAHSQGNLILSNALQAIEAVDGPQAIAGRVVHAFGSPTAIWPKGITKYEYGFTWDPITWLAGFDETMTISKVGMPAGSLAPVTHGFLEYLKRDPAFFVNRFRCGVWPVTFSMDEEGLASALVALGPNAQRVLDVFKYLESHHQSDVDDIALSYVEHAKKSAAANEALASHHELRELLIRSLEKGWTGSREVEAVEYIRSL